MNSSNMTPHINWSFHHDSTIIITDVLTVIKLTFMLSLQFHRKQTLIIIIILAHAYKSQNFK